eukprot:TRINITY_DN3909_c0_g1_i2.p11 TRINITY_DN3909_c0_g1~~TRINITY_DN3909_c0_g1_i2.p11  ORF type:complete len:102 (+),score=0.06 TRINITY_DN3909_c0_g1_i2:2092-2397(+)
MLCTPDKFLQYFILPEVEYDSCQYKYEYSVQLKLFKVTLVVYKKRKSGIVPAQNSIGFFSNNNILLTVVLKIYQFQQYSNDYLFPLNFLQMTSGVLFIQRM